jgi:hypothetical protein
MAKIDDIIAEREAVAKARKEIARRKKISKKQKGTKKKRKTKNKGKKRRKKIVTTTQTKQKPITLTDKEAKALLQVNITAKERRKKGAGRPAGLSFAEQRAQQFQKTNVADLSQLRQQQQIASDILGYTTQSRDPLQLRRAGRGRYNQNARRVVGINPETQTGDITTGGYTGLISGEYTAGGGGVGQQTEGRRILGRGQRWYENDPSREQAQPRGSSGGRPPPNVPRRRGGGGGGGSNQPPPRRPVNFTDSDNIELVNIPPRTPRQTAPKPKPKPKRPEPEPERQEPERSGISTGITTTSRGTQAQPRTRTTATGEGRLLRRARELAERRSRPRNQRTPTPARPPITRTTETDTDDLRALQPSGAGSLRSVSTAPSSLSDSISISGDSLGSFELVDSPIDPAQLPAVPRVPASRLPSVPTIDPSLLPSVPPPAVPPAPSDISSVISSFEDLGGLLEPSSSGGSTLSLQSATTSSSSDPSSRGGSGRGARILPPPSRARPPSQISEIIEGEEPVVLFSDLDSESSFKTTQSDIRYQPPPTLSLQSATTDDIPSTIPSDFEGDSALSTGSIFQEEEYDPFGLGEQTIEEDERERRIAFQPRPSAPVPQEETLEPPKEQVQFLLRRDRYAPRISGRPAEPREPEPQPEPRPLATTGGAFRRTGTNFPATPQTNIPDEEPQDIQVPQEPQQNISRGQVLRERDLVIPERRQEQSPKATRRGRGRPRRNIEAEQIENEIKKLEGEQQDYMQQIDSVVSSVGLPFRKGKLNPSNAEPDNVGAIAMYVEDYIDRANERRASRGQERLTAQQEGVLRQSAEDLMRVRLELRRRRGLRQQRKKKK